MENKTNQEYPLIYIKIPIIMGKVGAIKKDRKNPQQGYQFRGIDDICNALNKHLSEEGVFVVSEVINMKREERKAKSGSMLMCTILDMKFKFCAEDGSFVQSTMVGEAMDMGDKSCNKAMSNAYKYALMQIFCIPTEENKDSENNTYEISAHQYATSAQIRKCRDLGTKLFKDDWDEHESKLLETYKVANLKDMDTKQMDDIIARLEKKEIQQEVIK